MCNSWKPCLVRYSTCTAKTRCLAYIIGYFFSLLYTHACYATLCFKEKYAKNMKSKKNQNALIYGCKRISRRCVSYVMYLKGDGPYQTVMIVCGCIWFSYIITLHIMRLFYFIAQVSHTTHILFVTLDTIVQVQRDLAITRNTSGSLSLLNCLNLFLKIKLVRLV